MTDNLMGSFRRDICYQVSLPQANRIRLTATMRDVYHDILLDVLVDADSSDLKF